MNPNTALRIGFKQARKITANYAKTFYFASHFLPREKKLAAYSIYAVCRASDESVDAGLNISGKRLQEIRRNIQAVYSEAQLNNNLLLAFRQTVQNYDIPRIYFDELLSGMQMDLDKKVYDSFSELYGYCYRVAGVVGLMMLQVFGFRNPRAREYAVDLGIAMQLTNILRDIKEDLDRGRLYLPQEELLKFNVGREQLAQGRIDANFIDLIQYQISRARQYYKSGEQGIELINCPFCRFVARAMEIMYSGILDDIEKNNYDVFSHRACVTLPEKIRSILQILTRRTH
ncbi:MAG: phytoene/squalene synthase family protein [Candidatus Omnitrophota bacterium]